MHSPHLSARQLFSSLFILFVGLLAASALSAWTGPTAAAPAGNVAAPINVGTTDQVKNAGISVNSLAVFGSQYIQDKLGIGRSSPVVPLDVNGTIRIANSGEVCQAVTEGAVRYNSSTQVLQLCDGTNWRTITLSSPPSTKRIFLTSNTGTCGANCWTVPTDWNSSNNTIEVIGGGAGGGLGSGNFATAGGGGGGGYSKVTNLALTPGNLVHFTVGAGGGQSTSGGDTWFSIVNAAPTSASGGALAKGGTYSNSGGAGGSAAAGVGNTKYSGGSGGASGIYGAAGGGGGGAAGPNGAGNNGIAVGPCCSFVGGAGGSGDAGSGGSGSGSSGGVGGNGTEWDSMHGSGGGGSGGSYSVGNGGGAGGSYGAGGAGGSGNDSGGAAGGSGSQGIIVITYTSL